MSNPTNYLAAFLHKRDISHFAERPCIEMPQECWAMGAARQSSASMHASTAFQGACVEYPQGWEARLSDC